MAITAEKYNHCCINMYPNYFKIGFQENLTFCEKWSKSQKIVNIPNIEPRNLSLGVSSGKFCLQKSFKMRCTYVIQTHDVRFQIQRCRPEHHAMGLRSNVT
jgi:hypothetical protein